MTRESKKKRHAERNSNAQKLNRRTFVKLVPALGVAAATMPHIATKSLGQNPTPTPTPLPTPTPTPTPAPLRVTKDMLRGAEQLFGLELTEAHKQMAWLTSYNLGGTKRCARLSSARTEPATFFTR